MNVYMIGIGGTSMRGLAKILLAKGMAVWGSDPRGNSELEDMGCVVFSHQQKENIPKDTHVVVYSSAIKKDNPELLFAREKKMCVFSRGELLGLISRGYKNVVAISGSHGKTTTTAMLASVLKIAGKNATFHFGADSGNDTSGSGEDIFLCEACEYHNNFLHLAPSIGVILNMQFDHPDFFDSETDVVAAFSRFSRKCKAVITSKKIKELLGLQNAFTCEVVAENVSCYPEETPNCTPFSHVCQAEFAACNLSKICGAYSFDFFAFGRFIAHITLKQKGEFQVENALFALAAGHMLGGSESELKKGISSFFGVERRQEIVGELKNAEVICDYAHHPTQIAEIAKAYKNQNTVVIFQPHTFSRTQTLLHDFVSALSQFPCVVITSTFPAREAYSYLGSGEFLAANIPNCTFVQEENLQKHMLHHHMKSVNQTENTEKTTYIFMGAGNSHIQAKEFLKNAEKAEKHTYIYSNA